MLEMWCTPPETLGRESLGRPGTWTVYYRHVSKSCSRDRMCFSSWLFHCVFRWKHSGLHDRCVTLLCSAPAKPCNFKFKKIFCLFLHGFAAVFVFLLQQKRFSQCQPQHVFLFFFPSWPSVMSCSHSAQPTTLSQVKRSGPGGTHHVRVQLKSYQPRRLYQALKLYCSKCKSMWAKAPHSCCVSKWFTVSLKWQKRNFIFFYNVNVFML